MTTLQTVELGVLGPLQVRQYGLPVTIPGAKPRAVLTMLGLYGGSVVSADTLVELLWGVDPPRTAAKALQTHVSALRRTLGDGFVLTEGTGWTLSTTEIDASRYKLAVKKGREAVAAGDASRAVADFDEALNLWRGTPELPDGPRGVSEKTRWIEGHAALVEDRADALLATGRAAEIVGELEAAIADAPLRERRWGQLMLALYRAGRQGEALGAYQRARALLAEELGVDPGPDLRRLEAAIVAQDTALEMPVSQQLSAVTRAVTFLLTDIEGSTAAWEANADAMAVALARHDEIVEQVVTSRGGRLIKTRGEGDATFSVFERPSAAAAAAIELQEAIRHEPWALLAPMRIRVALHTGEVELRDGDYFGRAVNRAARLRSLAEGGQILCSGATAELVIDSLRDDVLLADLGMRHLKNLARPEHVFELRLQTDDSRAPTADSPIERPALPAVLAGPGPFVGRGLELERLRSAWQTALATGTGAVLIAGEPGVGKTRLAGEWCRQADDQGAVVLYGRCDEDLGAPYQPFAEALRSLVPCVGTKRLRGLRGVEALLPLVPALSDVLPDLAAPPRADPDTERYALFDAVVGLLGIASASAPVVLVLDDLHWAAKPTLLLLRHLLRFGEQARVQIVGTYRSTDLDRAHPLAAMLADLHRDGSADRLSLSGLDENDVTAYVAEAGYDDEELARALASVTGGNPFFLIEALRHVDESGGRWDPGTLPQGVREAVSRRLSRLPVETNKALAAAAVVGSRFAVDLVERVVDQDLVDAFDEACKAGILIEEPGGRYRFNHAIVRQSLLTELASVRRMRLHQRIAVTLETEPGADDELLAELAYHYFECAWAGNAAKAVDYCRRAADQAMARLAYEGAADLYDKALHALEELDEELPDRDDQLAELLIARCEALLAAGDVASARGAVAQLQAAAADSARLAAWGTCFDSELSMLTDPERLDEIESALAAAAAQLVGLEDSAGEAKAHTVRAGCLARLGRIGDAETALDQALTAARRAREHRRVNSVLANAPLAALWGPNPVPRAGGRCLDVVRLLRITTGSPVVEATSTRCQGVLDAFRGRAAAGRQLIDSARRSLTELGMRHALLEVDQFAGIVELVADDPVAAVPYLRRAYEGFRRMGLDADTAETAALLARACLALDRDAEADELCTESERLAGHALKASITWRTVRAQLLSRRGDHGDARRVAGEAVAIAERTDALVDHGDADLALAMVLGAAGDVTGARAAAEQAVALYERKGAAALAEKARKLTGATHVPATPKPGEPPTAKLDNACARVIRAMHADFDREAFDEAEQMYAPNVFVESRRKIVGFAQADVPSGDWPQVARHLREGWAWIRYPVIAVRGERLALTRIELGANDMSPGAPHEEFLGLWGLDEGGRIALQVFFDIDDLDAAMAELEAVHARIAEAHPRVTRLQNTASRVDDECYALFAAGRIEEIGALYADDIKVDDRRHGLRRETNNRTTAIDNVRAIAALGALVTNTPLALRGDRLCLSHIVFERRDAQPDGFKVETLELTEVDADGLMVARVVFDVDDLDAAHEELNARYLAGEAAPYAEAWRTVMAGGDTLNRHEPGAMAQRIAVFADHRRIPFAADDIGHATDRLWALVPDARYRIAAVHALDHHGAVVNLVIEGTDSHGNEVQWSATDVITFVSSEQVRLEVYEEYDIDAAVARFEDLRPRTRLENAASRVYERVKACFAAGDWDAMAATMADDIRSEDRRRVVNAGVQHGRDAVVAEIAAIAEVGDINLTSDVIATRGEHLVLSRGRASVGDQQSEAFRTDLIDVIEINADEQAVGRVVFDPDDVDAAFTELDARYLAGEASAHAHTWSVVAEAYASFNRHEPLAMDWVFVDHRRGTPFASNVLASDGHAAVWDLTPELRIYVEMVHRLSDRGVVVTHNSYGSSPEGFGAEWRMIQLLTVDGGRIKRCELFDEADLDAALARFDELTRPAPLLMNRAIEVDARCNACFAARDWRAFAELMAEDISIDDRRRVVGAGMRRGRDAEAANVQAIAELGCKDIASTPIAIRGDRLALTRNRFSGRDLRAEAFHSEALVIVEIDTEGRVAARVSFDTDDIDAAFEELDARYVAGEAASHAHTWSLVAATFAALNRHEVPATTPDWVHIDHRQIAMYEVGDLPVYLNATWDLTPQSTTYVEAVHRLTDVGAVVTNVAQGTSHEGFEVEWREISVITFEGDKISRGEDFDEADLDAALARFEELTPTAPRPENTASRVVESYLAHFASRDWGAMAEALADDFSADDHRRVVNSGVRRGRDTEIVNMRAIAELGCVDITPTPIATRGEHLVLGRHAFSSDWSAQLTIDVIEVNADNKIAALITFDVEDIDDAFEELDARYLAGEAAAHADTWSAISQAYAALNRHELAPTTWDWVNIDHRRLATIEAGELTASIRAGWDLATDSHIYVETVHRLNQLGAVVTWAANGVSRQGLEVEERDVSVFTVEGGLISRCELFDESDLDAALARFDELSRPVRRLENAASRLYERRNAYFAARDWDALAETLADAVLSDDRRRVVSAGVRRGRDAQMASNREAAAVGVTNITSTVIAIRGERLTLTRTRISGRDQRPDAFHAELLGLVEIDADERMVTYVAFDLEDIDAALTELDDRYLAGDAARCANTWSCIKEFFSALNRRETPATSPDWINVDRRRIATIEPGEMIAYLHEMGAIMPQTGIYIEAVHRLEDFGAVVTHVTNGTTQQGFDAQWRVVDLMTVQDGMHTRCEIFDEIDLETALAHFAELGPTPPRLENAASRMYDRFNTFLASRDWDALGEIVTDDVSNDDRRRVVSAGVLRGRDAQIENFRAIVDVGVKKFESTVIASRGERLALTRTCAWVDGQRREAFGLEMLTIVEIAADNRISAGVTFDVQDIDAAFAELETRYLAGEAAPYAEAWSVISRVSAAFNRREIYPTTPNFVSLDHRRGAAAFAPGDLIPYIRASWTQIPDLTLHIEAVHRLTNLGAVYTQVLKGTSEDGFTAEWRIVEITTVEGHLVSRAEIFDEADLDSAVARFEDLSPTTPRLYSAAAQAYERQWSYFAGRDWAAYEESLADDFFSDDRRRVIGAGIRRGRDAAIAEARAAVGIGVTNKTSTVIATRGDRLALERVLLSGRDPHGFNVDALQLVEFTDDGRLSVLILFDLDDIDSAFRELETRYLAGEAAPYAKAWSVISRAYAAFNRREMFPTTTDFVSLDHRRGAAAFAPGDLTAYIRAAWDQIPNLTLRIEAVHRLTRLGAVYTQVLKGTSEEGFAAEWRLVGIMMAEGDLVSRAEIFDEADLDAAVQSFDGLGTGTNRLENAATQAWVRLADAFNRRDAPGFLELVNADVRYEDRRKGLRDSLGGSARQKATQVLFETAPSGWEMTVESVALRGSVLSLTRDCYRDAEADDRPIVVELLHVTEVASDGSMKNVVSFDVDDIDAAFAELDARYLAGEAAGYADTWSVLVQGYAAANRHELAPTTPDFVNIDHRPLALIGPGDLIPYLRSTFDVTPNLSTYIEAVHRLRADAALFTHVGKVASEEGFDAEWRLINLIMLDGNRMSRCEIFDESQFDAALARFDELNQPVHRLENAASQVAVRVLEQFAGRDWDAMVEILADDYSSDDRRPVVGAGARHGRDDAIANWRVMADLGFANPAMTVIATRGERLALACTSFSGRDQGSDAFLFEAVGILEINADAQITSIVVFDVEDIDAVFAELDARYLAGEAGDYAHTWSLVASAFAAFNRRAIPATTPNWVNTDRRRGAAFAPGDAVPYVRAAWDVAPDINIYVETVHRLGNVGAVVTYAATGTSGEGFHAEWREIAVLMFEGELISRCEIFDDTDLDTALATFDEFNAAAPQFGNAAIRTWTQIVEAINRRDASGFHALSSADGRLADRRKGLRAWHEGTERRKAAESMCRAPASWRMEVEPVAVRGDRFGLTRERWRDTDEADSPITVESLTLTEATDDGLVYYTVVFDPDDINGAFAELTARWIASGEVAHPEVIETQLRVVQAVNNHDWDTYTALCGGASGINHRQLGIGDTFADFTASLQTMVSLAPNLWVELSEILACSALGVVSSFAIRGTLTHGSEVEIPAVLLYLMDGDHVKWIESFDGNQRDLALARFEELSRA